MLEAIAEGWGVALTDEQLPEIVERLAMEMTDPANIKLVLQHLNDTERQALAWVAASDQVKAHVLIRKYGELRHWGPGKLEWAQARRKPVSAVERLWFLGLLHVTYGMDERFRGQFFFIPSEIRATLPPMSVAMPIFQVETASNPSIAQDASDALARDVFLLLSFLRNNQVRTRTGQLSNHDMTRLQPRWADAITTARLSFVQHLCRTSGLGTRVQGVWKPTSAAADWLKASPCGRQRTLYQAWRQDAEWNELWLMPSVRCEQTGWQNDPIVARQGVLDFLAHCPVDTWCTIESFVAALHELTPDFLRPDGDYDSWYIRDAKTGHYLTGYQNWDKVEGALIRYLLASSLSWLGIVALGYVEGVEQPDRFMLTSEGSAILGLIQASKPAQPPFLLRSGMQVFVPREANWYDRYLLERFARWLGEQSGGAIYVLDRASVRGGLQNGIHTDPMLAFLQRTTGGALPTPVIRTLKAWSH